MRSNALHSVHKQRIITFIALEEGTTGDCPITASGRGNYCLRWCSVPVTKNIYICAASHGLERGVRDPIDYLLIYYLVRKNRKQKHKRLYIFKTSDQQNVSIHNESNTFMVNSKLGKDKEVHQLGRGSRRGGRVSGAEAEDLVPGEQPGTADEGAQAAGARQRRPALRAAQAREAPARHHGTRQGARDRAQGNCTRHSFKYFYIEQVYVCTLI